MPERNALQRSLLCGALALLAGLFFSSAAHADTLDLSLESLPGSVSAGGAGSFEVLLTDASGSTGTGVTIAGFDFELQTDNSDVTLTDATTSTTDTYIFDGNSVAESFVGGDLVVSSSPFIANDEALSGGTTLDPGQSLALGEVFFSVSPSASTEAVDISFVPDFTDLSDPDGNPITIDSATGGTLNIVGSTTVPEPSSGLMLLSGLFLLVICFIGSRNRFKLASGPAQP